MRTNVYDPLVMLMGICYQSESHNPIEMARQARSAPHGPFLIVLVGICYQNESHNPIEMEIPLSQAKIWLTVGHNIFSLLYQVGRLLQWIFKSLEG